MVFTFSLGFILSMLATIAQTSSKFGSKPSFRNTLLAIVKSLPIIDNPKVKCVYMSHTQKSQLSGIDNYDSCTTNLNHAVLLTGFGV